VQVVLAWVQVVLAWVQVVLDWEHDSLFGDCSQIILYYSRMTRTGPSMRANTSQSRTSRTAPKLRGSRADSVWGVCYQFEPRQFAGSYLEIPEFDEQL